MTERQEGTPRKRSVDVIYDGEVLRPQEPLDLEPNGRYRVTIEPEPSEAKPEGPPGAPQRISDLAQDLGVEDLAEQHDHYLYGTPKR